MKSAVILPQAFLPLVKEDDYHMALAHLVQKPGFEAYTEFYKEQGLRRDSFLIMDTGLIEGDARPVEELIAKAGYLHADEMAINDVFMDREGTLATSYDALTRVIASGLNIRTMGIPQGNCLEDWIECAKEMMTWGFDTFGIPKVLVHLEGMQGRLRALAALKELDYKGDVHLLGCWETPLELKMIAAAERDGLIVPVRGVDSAIAYAYARAGVRITDDERPEGAINFGAQTCDLNILQYNIDVYKSESATMPPREETGNVIKLV